MLELAARQGEVGVRPVLVAVAVCACFQLTRQPVPAAGANEVPNAATRLAANPLVTVGSSPTFGDDVNGPSVIGVPAWVSQPLGRDETWPWGR